MAKLQAKKIAEALRKAQRVGEVEEEFQISGCKVVLRSLRNDEYEAVTSSTTELEDIAYVIAFKVEHLCRSIIEINGESLRNADFIEVEVENAGKVDTVTLERHQFVRDYILSTWSREAVDTAFRKFNDVVAKAERVASEGVVFDTPDETAEEKYRRLLMEAKDIEGSVPFELAAKTRDEFGYLLKEEWSKADEKLSAMKLGDEPSEPAPVQEAPRAAPEPPKPAPEPLKAASIESILKAPPKAPVAIPPMGEPVPVDPSVLRRASEIEALEGGVGEEPVASAPQARDAEGAKRILDQPPVGGINPRFKAPPRL